MEAQAQQLKEQGNKAFAEERNDEAIRLYSEALSIGPTAVLYSNRAAAYLKLAKYEEALKDAEAAIRLDPSYVKAYVRKGNALAGLGKLNEAKAAFQAGLRVEPSSALLKEKLAELTSKTRVATSSSTTKTHKHAKEEDGKESGLGEFAPRIASFVCDWSEELDELLKGRPSAKSLESLDSLMTVFRGIPHLGRRLNCIDTIIAGVWSIIAEHPSLMRITAEMLQPSAVLGALFSFLKAVCVFSSDVDITLRKGGRLLAAAITSAFDKPVDAERAAHLILLLDWFAERCKAEPLKLTDPWGVRDSFANKHPMMAAVLVGTPALVSFVASKGVSVQASSLKAPYEEQALWAAFRRGRADNFARLLELGADFDFNFVGYAVRFAWRCTCFPEQEFSFRKACNDDGTGSVRFARVTMLRDVLTRQPSFLRAQYLDKEGQKLNLLDTAVESGVAAVVDLLIGLGIKPRFSKPSTLEEAIWHEHYEVVETLVKKHKVAESNSQYNDAALHMIAWLVAVAAVNSYPHNPLFDGPSHFIAKRADPDRSKIVDLILGSGLKASWKSRGQNALLSVLYSGEKHSLLSEDHTLELLERFRRAGWNVSAAFEKDASVDNGGNLAVAAVLHRQYKVAEYAIETAGCDVDVSVELSNGDKTTALVCCLDRKELAFAERLLTRHKAKAAYPGARVVDQPVFSLLDGSEYTDAQAEKFLRLMIANNPDLLELECYREKGVPGTRTGTVEWTPILSCVRYPKPRCLQLLLTSLPAAKQMARQRVTGHDPSLGEQLLQNNALLHALSAGAWECAAVLMRHANPSVTEELEAGFSESGQQLYHISAFELVVRALATPTPPPRSLVSAIQAAAMQELGASRRKQEGASDRNTSASRTRATGEGATTNAFEVPTHADENDDFGAGALSQGKKQGAKKKSGKKKGGKGKKKKHGKAAVASGIDGESSSEEDEEPFDEPDDNLVDSRYAPSLDVMLAERERERERQAREAGSKPSKK